MSVLPILLTLLLLPAHATQCPTTIATLNTVGTVSATTTGGSDLLTSSCGGAGGLDTQVEFTAPIAGEYVFSTAGSTFDTVLQLVDSTDCISERACDDDTLAPASMATLTMAAGETVVVSIDGDGPSESGDFTLTINLVNAGTCSYDEDLGDAVNLTFTGSTVWRGDDVSPVGCGRSAAPDVTHLWVAPYSGTFVADTFGSSFDTVLELAGPTCGPGICDDDSSAGPHSSITFAAVAGDAFHLVVDGRRGDAGAYRLNLYDAAICRDDDGDSLCDNGANDLCFGDDATGDADADGRCDDRDFTLQVDPAQVGQRLQVDVFGAPPRVPILIFRSTSASRPGSGPCAPTGNGCLGFSHPFRTPGAVITDANGHASVAFDVPVDALPGRVVAFQAAYIDGPTSDTSEVEVRIITP